jgi:hypothetical protein
MVDILWARAHAPTATKSVDESRIGFSLNGKQRAPDGRARIAVYCRDSAGNRFPVEKAAAQPILCRGVRGICQMCTHTNNMTFSRLPSRSFALLCTAKRQPGVWSLCSNGPPPQ